jgi:glycosyltransferase involved in cell wall biosynthesis
VSAPLVSIGLPVRNGAPLLDRAVAALRRQTWPAIELLVSDNASTDATASILRDHADADARLVVEHLAGPIEGMANFDRVLRRATGRYFMWAAHDDDWAPDHVARLAARLEADEDVVLAAPVTDVVDLEGRVLRRHERLVDLPRDDVVERLLAFVAQPEAEGKANLIYGLFRREVLAGIDVLGLLAADPRRYDYHVVLAALAAGRLVVDPGVRFRKTVAPVPATDVVARLRRARASLHAELGWIGAYEDQVAELVPLDAEQRRRLHAVVRGRRRRHLVDRAVRRIGVNRG